MLAEGIWVEGEKFGEFQDVNKGFSKCLVARESYRLAISGSVARAGHSAETSPSLTVRLAKIAKIWHFIFLPLGQSIL